MDDMRDSLSKIKKNLKKRLAERKHKPDGTGADIGGERTDSTTSLPQPDPHVVVGGSHDREEDRANAAGEQTFSADSPSQPDGPGSGPAPGSDNGQEEGEADVDGGGANQRYSQSHPNAGSGRSGELEGVCPSPPVQPPISHGEEPDST